MIVIIIFRSIAAAFAPNPLTFIIFLGMQGVGSGKWRRRSWLHKLMLTSMFSLAANVPSGT